MDNINISAPLSASSVAPSTNSQFALWRKWFWVGIVMSILNVTGGLVYGIALAFEKDHRKEGYIVIAFAFVWFLFTLFVLAPWLLKSGILQNYIMPRMK